MAKNKNKLKTFLKGLMTDTIKYDSRRDPSEIAKDIKFNRDRNATKLYQDNIKEGHAYFGKQAPKRKETRKLPKIEDQEDLGKGWGEPGYNKPLPKSPSSLKERITKKITSRKRKENKVE